MILITGASGKTGQALIRALAKHGKEPVRALVRSPEQGTLIKALGAEEVSIGDMRDPQIIKNAVQSIRAVYHICPNMSPDELTIAEILFTSARTAQIEHFVYHSVLHPQVEAMPHHWLKMRVEEQLFTSNLPFTILQPGPYMQNVLAYWDSIQNQGVYAVPYATSARLSIVNLEDIAEAAAKVLLEPGHIGSIYELGGPEALSQVEVARILEQGLNHPVEARSVDCYNWEINARASGMAAYTIDTLLKMFSYYEIFGLVGNSRVLEWLLNRPPSRFSDFVAKVINGG